jgi:hypothetical protein
MIQAILAAAARIGGTAGKFLTKAAGTIERVAVKAMAESISVSRRAYSKSILASKGQRLSAGKAASKTREGKAYTRAMKRNEKREKPRVTRAQLLAAANDLVKFVKNVMRTNALGLPAKSRFTRATQQTNSTKPLIDTGAFIESLTSKVAVQRIHVFFPPTKHPSGLTNRDIYNIVSRGATVPVTPRTRAYFYATEAIVVRASVFRVPARPFLRRAVMLWAVKNKRFAPYVVLPPY